MATRCRMPRRGWWPEMSAYEVIPEELRQRPQWINWRFVERGGKLQKVPVSARTGQSLDHLDPANHRSFEDTVHFLDSEYIDGVGYVFSEEDPFLGVDLDDVLDPDTGEIQSWAANVVEKLDSYAEISPSGTGVHIIMRGKIPANRKRGPLEIYDHAHFFTITGKRLSGTPKQIEEHQEALDSFYAEHVAPGGDEDISGESGLGGSPEMSDDEIIERCRKAKNGQKFERLWSGDMDGYSSQSEADQALVSILAFSFFPADPDTASVLHDGKYCEV
jgi:putative DNA primase/helicase